MPLTVVVVVLLLVAIVPAKSHVHGIFHSWEECRVNHKFIHGRKDWLEKLLTTDVQGLGFGF
jgi:hypothetical protein